MKFKMQIFNLKLKNEILTHVSFIENYARLLLDC
jgi:hypothetical protein